MDLEIVKPILPQLILMIAALLVPAVGIVRNKFAVWFTIAAVIVAMFATGYLMYDGYAGNFMGMFVFNEFTGLMTFMFLIVLLLVALMSISGNEMNRRRGEYFALLTGATVGMIFVAGATNLIVMFVGIELTSISSYALVAFRKNDPRSAEAAVKYLIIGGISTALSLYGISLLYGLAGTVTLTGPGSIAEYLAAGSYSWAYIVAVITIIAGFGFKVAIVPFHFWAPDVYEGAPTSITTFLAVGSKKMGFIVFFKIFLVMFVAAQTLSNTLPELQWIFAIIAAVTMTVGNLIAISQSNIKRMLAYSSIAQAGYIMIVLAIGTPYALEGGIFHMITHVFMKGGAFIIVAA
jgi:NADH-quinone oxidoreductase subunit N